MNEPRLIERHVALLVSEDTKALWDEMAHRMGVDTFDGLVQVLTMLGAYLVVCTDPGGYDIDPKDLEPEAIGAVVWPWLRQRTAASRDAPSP